MSLANKPLNEIVEADLQELIDNQVAEGKEYDYKLEPWGGSDKDKKEFRYDVSSFANTSGGYIILGMDEKGGLPTAIVGLQGDMDQEILRLEGILRAGISPRIQGINMRAVPVQSGNVLIIHIRRSWAAPHMVTFEDNSRFYARHSRGKYLLDVDELRSAFTLSESVSERIRNFRLDRIAKIAADETPIILGGEAKLVLHLIPITGFASNAFERTELLTGNEQRSRISYWLDLFGEYFLVYRYRYNLDGVLFYGANREDILDETYIQLFRNGIIELVDTSILKGEDKTIPSVAYEQVLLDLLQKFFNMQEKLGVQPPIAVMLTLLDVNGYTMGVRRARIAISNNAAVIDRDNLLIPEILIQSFSSNLSLDIRALFDAVWNSCGYSQSLNYDKDGNWRPLKE